MTVLVPLDVDPFSHEEKLVVLGALFDSLGADILSWRMSGETQIALLSQISAMRANPDGGPAWNEFRPQFTEAYDRHTAAIAESKAVAEGSGT